MYLQWQLNYVFLSHYLDGISWIYFIYVYFSDLAVNNPSNRAANLFMGAVLAESNLTEAIGRAITHWTYSTL